METLRQLYVNTLRLEGYRKRSPPQAPVHTTFWKNLFTLSSKTKKNNFQPKFTLSLTRLKNREVPWGFLNRRVMEKSNMTVPLVSILHNPC